KGVRYKWETQRRLGVPGALAAWCSPACPASGILRPARRGTQGLKDRKTPGAWDWEPWRGRAVATSPSHTQTLTPEDDAPHTDQRTSPASLNFSLFVEGRR